MYSRDPNIRGTRTVYVRQGYDFPRDGKASEFIEWFGKALKEIPGEYRNDAHFDFDSNYDGGQELKVTYVRPETDAEWEERKRQAVMRSQSAEHDLRRQYEALKAKFEGGE